MPEYSIEYPRGPQSESPHQGKVYSLIEETVTRTSPKEHSNIWDDANTTEELNTGSRALALTILNRAEIEGVPRLKRITIGTRELLGEEKKVRTAEIEKVEGETLNQLENTSLKQRKKIITQLARISSECARVGILHNDISPKNILYDTKRDKTYLVDFDAALLMDTYGSEELAFARIRTGGVPYTMAYASPEKLDYFQEEGSPDTISEKSDIYSIACVGLALLVGIRNYEDAFVMIHEDPEPILKTLIKEGGLSNEPFCTYLLEQMRENPQDRSAKTLKQLYEKLNTLENEA